MLDKLTDVRIHPVSSFPFVMYPSITSPDFTKRLFEKCEFAEVAAGRTIEQKLIGLRKHQNFVQRFISPTTPYTSLLLIHVTGSGKTWSMASIIDNFKSVKRRAIVLLQGATAIGAFTANMEEWFRKYYGVEENTSAELKRYMQEYIDIRRYITFTRLVGEMSDEAIVKEFSNRIFIIDEAHHLSIKTTDGTKHTYNQLLRLLGLVKNCRVIVSTATPIVDVHTEIYSMVNLILPVSERLTSGASQNLDNLRRVVTGRVSYFMQDMGDKPRVIEVGTAVRNFDQRLIFVRMQSCQLEAYTSLPKTSAQMYMDEKYTSLLVLPKDVEGDAYGYIHDRAEIPDNYLKEFATASKGVPLSQFADDEVRSLVFNMFCDRIRSPSHLNIGLYAFSCKLGYIVDELTKQDRCREKCFIFCREVQAFGIKSISAILHAIGFDFYDGSVPIEEMSVKPRFTIITGEGSNTSKRTESHMARLNVFNDDRNRYGFYLRILIVSDVGSESLTLKCVRQVHVLTPFWNNNKTVQVIARAVRMQSHAVLPPEERYVRVYRYIAVANPSGRFLPFTVGNAFDAFADEVTIDDVQDDIDGSIDMKEQFRANGKMIMALHVGRILEEQSIDRRLWTHPPATVVDRSNLCRFYSHVPTQPLVNRMSKMLLEFRNVSLDHLCAAKGLQFEAFRSLVDIVRRQVLTVVSDGGAPHCINVSCNVLYLETVIGKKDCVFLPLPKTRHPNVDVAFLNDVSPNAMTILREIEQLGDTTEMCERLATRIAENTIDLVVAVEQAIQLDLPNLKELFKSGWIEHNGRYYHMVYETVWKSAAYKKSCAMNVSRLARHVRVLQNNKWVQDRSGDVHDKLVRNYNRVREEFEAREHRIYAFYVLSDRMMRIRDTSRDELTNKRLNNRGRVISYYQDNVDIKLVFLKLVYLELTFAHVVDLASRLPPVTVTRELMNSNPISIDGETDATESLKQFLRYPFHAHVTYYALSQTRNEMIRLVHDVCKRYDLYVVVM